MVSMIQGTTAESGEHQVKPQEAGRSWLIGESVLTRAVVSDASIRNPGPSGFGSCVSGFEAVGFKAAPLQIAEVSLCPWRRIDEE